ncbi:cupin domain-containing protein [Brachybacterium avium]|nr:cupin domain-containing protein [Brachybacterium avium]
MSDPTTTRRPVYRPDGFGTPASRDSDPMTVLPLTEQAPAPNPQRPRPAVKRLLQGDGANLIAFTFAPGQNLPDHTAAHPIIVQCVSGTLDFSSGGDTERLRPGTVIHLREGVMHRVDCPADAAEEASVLLLTMLTGERHQG